MLSALPGPVHHSSSPLACSSQGLPYAADLPRQETNTPSTRKQQPYSIQSGGPRAHRRGQENVLCHPLILYREHPYRASMDRGGKDGGEGEEAPGLWGHSHHCLWGLSRQLMHGLHRQSVLDAGLRIGAFLPPAFQLLLAPATLLPHPERTHAPPTCPYCQTHVYPSLLLS